MGLHKEMFLPWFKAHVVFPQGNLAKVNVWEGKLECIYAWQNKSSRRMPILVKYLYGELMTETAQTGKINFSQSNFLKSWFQKAGKEQIYMIITLPAVLEEGSKNN